MTSAGLSSNYNIMPSNRFDGNDAGHGYRSITVNNIVTETRHEPKSKLVMGKK